MGPYKLPTVFTTPRARAGLGSQLIPGDNCVQAAEHSQWPMKTPLASSHARTGKKLAGSSHPQLPPQLPTQTWQPLTFHTARCTLFTSWCFNSLAHLILNVAPPIPQPGSPGGHQDLQSISTNRPLGLGIQVQRVWVEQADLPPTLWLSED